jgi:hypothetical protein
MFKRTSAAVVALLLPSIAFAGGKSKDKPYFPAYILSAHTVTVLVDPTAGISIDDPRANQVAQKDVEAALLKWGRFMPVLSTEQTDLIIVIRKGSGKLANVTISDPRQNHRAGVINPTDNGIGIGAQQGRPPAPTSNPFPGDQAPGARPQAEIGGTEDSFLVYEGKVEHPLDSVPGWRYQSNDALHAHNVPAVEKFRKAIEEAEKAAAKQSQQKPQSRAPAAGHPANQPAPSQCNP